ncbi:MAG: hypothetical protein HPY66_0418 [Firmicutes bacterium]|nr:hypothetical protein [Bacillota bacterium]
MSQNSRKLTASDKALSIILGIIQILYVIYLCFGYYYPREFAALVDFGVDFDKIVIEKGTSNGYIPKRDADKKRLTK